VTQPPAYYNDYNDNQHIIMISEGSFDTEAWSNEAGMKRNKLHLKID